MKFLFILCIFIQWNAFGSDCNLIFDSKEPSRILEHTKAIDQMDADKAVLCFNELKSFLIEIEPHIAISDNNRQQSDIFSIIDENSRQEIWNASNI